jgi:DNA mismatch endonuclease (patch repair protein)
MTDNLTIEQRSYTMSRIRSTNTKPELVIRKLVHSRGLRFKIHVRSLRGCPDLVFGGSKVAVFVDGDFWHGWRFHKWGDNLAPYWKAKIEGNRRRDRLTFQWLRRNGWRVIRLWEHQVRSDPVMCVERIEQCVRLAKADI